MAPPCWRRCCWRRSAWPWSWVWSSCSSGAAWPRWVAEHRGAGAVAVDQTGEPRLLYLDPWLLALAKPSGLLSQPGLGPELADCLISRAQRRWPEARLVHRLDRDTSGLLLLARDADSHRRLSAAFAERRVRKTYLARVHGVPVTGQPLRLRCVGNWGDL
ncbi:MAG: hypothetical protein KFB97_05205 [Cyanobium sp. M30B3]|nr:MAG: hypothetical protein KFB97_05205 [Cyanobium sp. M30B3]